MARRGEAGRSRHGAVRRGRAGLGGRGRARHGPPRLGGLGVAGSGGERSGQAVEAGHGPVWFGAAWLGMVRRSWRVRAGPGRVRPAGQKPNRAVLRGRPSHMREPPGRQATPAALAAAKPERNAANGRLVSVVSGVFNASHDYPTSNRHQPCAVSLAYRLRPHAMRGGGLARPLDAAHS